MVKTKCFAKMKNGLLAKLFGAAVLSVGLIALAGTKAKAANEVEDNNTSTTATVFSVNEEITGNLYEPDDVDWYCFTLTEPGTVSVTFEHPDQRYSILSTDGWNLSLYGDGEGKVVYFSYRYDEPANRSTTQSYNLSAGTYYLKAEAWYPYYGPGDGEYKILVNFESSVGKDMEQENNDKAVNANSISAGKDYSGRISLENDRDWYVFDLDESSKITVTLSHDYIENSSYYWNVCIYDDDEMTNLLFDFKWPGNKEKQTSNIEANLGAGRYYVLVTDSSKWSAMEYIFRINTTPAGKKTMLRLYNPNSGEHFYTASEREKNALVAQGWSFEGKAWDAPEFSNTPVYRLYNKNSGDHHYTPNKKERDNLVKQGWKDEGIGWYSDDSKTTPLYRLYNPNAAAGSHHYTTSARERDNLVKQGWKDENIGWDGL